ncbi:NAD(P)H-dependent flavin oxidoreductase YrpB, nitropropane dioxygenase family [Nonomuraea solani]|uniref:NAD(P)H-dependent flavin oxidoreductase YrpB, nitropropane dioxygenase family n=1 Tax=Nonomuraea solani TaxID=1144553 RepID=A0A1H5WDH4_9ACTN|nr:nitronate monooxygenase [Nonomuraea solani]SEF97306.1 NAD(P)H-dependent flavin oxidoreductase YrpB, nitropropane dioxygenase family [Nonomuraea solani]
MSVLSTRLTAKYANPYPLACAGMAFVGETPDLAAAVTNAGGIGAIGAGLMPPDQLRATIREVRARTGGAPFNVNLISFFSTAEQVEVIAEERVPIASFHWGHPPADRLKLLREAGVSVWEQVGSADAARLAVDDGADVVIAQGWEAGGHNYGGLPTMVNVPAIVDAVGERAMVLAAGGITDGRQVAAALCLGADGVWVGTRMVASREARVHPEHHRRLVTATGESSVLTSIFGPEWPKFNPMRVQRNRVVSEWDDRLAEIPADLDSLDQVGRTVVQEEETPMRKFGLLLPVPETEADWEEMPWLMGQGVGLIHDIKPAAEIVRDMMEQAERVLTGFRA